MGEILAIFFINQEVIIAKIEFYQCNRKIYHEFSAYDKTGRAARQNGSTGWLLLRFGEWGETAAAVAAADRNNNNNEMNVWKAKFGQNFWAGHGYYHRILRWPR